MTDADCYDSIVIGGGVMGLASACHLAQKFKKRTLLLEQLPRMHGHGSSAGYSRIFRRTYEEAAYVPLVTASETLWQELEKQTNTKFFHRTGLLVSGPENHVQTLERVLDREGKEYKKMSWSDLRQRFPQFEKFPKDEHFIFDNFAAIIDVQEAMSALEKTFLANGGEFKTRQRVISIESTADGAVVRTSKDVYHCKSVVVTMGPWTPDFFPGGELRIPMQVKKVGVFYFKTKAEDGAYTFPNHPCNTRYFDENDPTSLIASLPEFEYPGYVKFAHHLGVDLTGVKAKDQTPFNDKLLTQMKNFIKTYFPWLHSEPEIVEYCLYTTTPDENFIIDRHPHMKNVVIGAGFSGHGFKMAPVIGQMLAELALNVPQSFDNSIFRIDRLTRRSKI